MRGKAGTLLFLLRRLGITPAYAGKSIRTRSPAPYTKDHPRLCGEKHVFLDRKRLYMGSPPPMRGKVAAVQKRVNQLRITPAYAGKSQIRLGLTS